MAEPLLAGTQRWASNSQLFTRGGGTHLGYKTSCPIHYVGFSVRHLHVCYHPGILTACDLGDVIDSR